MCEEYLKTFHKKELINILLDEDTTKHYSVYVNFLVLFESCQNLGLDLLNDSETVLDEWNNAALRAQMVLLKEVDKNCQLKSNIHCRIYNLTTCSQSYGVLFPDNKHVGKFVQLSGTVMRMTATKLLEYQRSYICAKCKTPTTVKGDYDKKYIIKEPKKCKNPEGCPGTNLVHLGELDSENCKDYQEIKIQERVKESGISALHNTLLVTLEDDLVDTCKPGDSVTICGLVKRRWGEFVKGKKIEIEITLKANYLQVDNKCFRVAATPENVQLFNSFWENYSDNPLLGRDTILKSICPQLYGLYLVKLAIAVVIAGGCQLEKTSTGIRTRSESHLLLVGDPGTGKSQLLRFASKIVPRAVLTTGVGSTAAGLTVTAVMEKGEWQLEAGALVMSDGGICCIDEFNSMKEHDRTSILEAMEQQTISIAKAGLVCKMNTRCSILAACNPKGNVDLSESLSMNIALPSPLLSRFDLLLILKDTVNEEWDNLIADYILNSNKTFSKFAKSNLWNEDTLQSYFVIIKKFLPKLTEDAELILSTYYQMQRRVDNRNKARTTVRLLESLIRLSQGHARLMYHEKVEVMDSIYAIILIDSSMERDSSIFNLNINANSIFPHQPSFEYRNMAEIVLNKLHLQQLLDKELEMLSKTKECTVQSRFFQKQNKSDDKKQNDIDLNSGNKKRTNVEDAENTNKKFRKNDSIYQCVEDSNMCNEIIEQVNKEQHTSTDEGYDTVSITSVNFNNTKNQTIRTRNKSVRSSEEKKFKYIPKPDNESVTSKINTEEKLPSPTDAFKNAKDHTAKIISQEANKVNHLKRFHNDSEALQKNKSNEHNVKKSQDYGTFERDLETLNLIPGVNDDFNIDLDFDWDNFDQNNCFSSTMLSQKANNHEELDSDSTSSKTPTYSKASTISKSSKEDNATKSYEETSKEDNFNKFPQNSNIIVASKSTKQDNINISLKNCVEINNFNELSQNSKIKFIHNKFSFKPKFSKRLSSNKSSNENIVIRDSISSNNSSLPSLQAKAIFETIDDIDELDLDI